MPLWIAYSIAAGAAGVVAGYIAGDGVSGASRFVKWAVIGGTVYVGAKALKVV